MLCKNSQDIQKYIKTILIHESLKLKDLADKMEQQPGTISAVLRQDNLSVNKIIDIMDALGYDVEINFTKRS